MWFFDNLGSQFEETQSYSQWITSDGEIKYEPAWPTFSLKNQKEKQSTDTPRRNKCAQSKQDIEEDRNVKEQDMRPHLSDGRQPEEAQENAQCDWTAIQLQSLRILIW